METFTMNKSFHPSHCHSVNERTSVLQEAMKGIKKKKKRIFKTGSTVVPQICSKHKTTILSHLKIYFN